ncbi:MAG: hypothetical protein Q7V53_07940 [Caldisericota bacterium]|jgi:hypothetical protein|nr:hypothetical protein [Caldisericota bacterium]
MGQPTRMPHGMRHTSLRNDILGILTELLFTCALVALAFILSVFFYRIRP